MQKFPGQGLNVSHSSDNAESLTARTPGHSQSTNFRFQLLKKGRRKASRWLGVGLGKKLVRNVRTWLGMEILSEPR